MSTLVLYKRPNYHRYEGKRNAYGPLEKFARYETTIKLPHFRTRQTPPLATNPIVRTELIEFASIRVRSFRIRSPVGAQVPHGESPKIEPWKRIRSGESPSLELINDRKERRKRNSRLRTKNTSSRPKLKHDYFDNVVTTDVNLAKIWLSAQIFMTQTHN
ncbi:hypothetical protein TcasGA2_TC011453 [Tribolium castaneum]|uniref:Uncharacterized protein n=1 Tax=Tribolium castaneum TaxID=7070 RepID=D6X4V2_TRICA|nr:hypothetical protein TcasGA2_TC011453 [Tribolium castaneum]